MRGPATRAVDPSFRGAPRGPTFLLFIRYPRARPPSYIPVFCGHGVPNRVLAPLFCASCSVTGSFLFFWGGEEDFYDDCDWFKVPVIL